MIDTHPAHLITVTTFARSHHLSLHRASTFHFLFHKSFTLIPSGVRSPDCLHGS